MQLSAATQAQHHFFLHLCEFVGLVSAEHTVKATFASPQTLADERVVMLVVFLLLLI